jgi:arylsulfatase A-like enzyme
MHVLAKMLPSFLPSFLPSHLMIDAPPASDVYMYCSPTRSSLLSGRLPVHVNTANEAPMAQGGGVHLGMSTIADMLVTAGYICHQVGKWNAGSSTYANLPYQRGFTSSLGYMGGMEDHYTQHGGYKAVTGAWSSVLSVERGVFVS